jgi:acetate kinase
LQIYEIKKYIGSYTAAMDGVDAIVFTGGIGENADDMRATVCDGLTFLGIKIDKEYNKTLVKGKEGEISTPDSKVRVFVLPTNEELVIARDTKEIVTNLKK